MRYAWHMREAYFGKTSLRARLIDSLLAGLRNWDRRTASRVSHFIAISKTVQQRIRECYGRESTVIYPLVDTDFYTPALVPREDYYLALSAFAPYKRLDLAVDACNRLRKKLIIIGAGQDAKRLQALAGPTIRFLGWQTDNAIRDHLRRCRALIFPGEEDFGIVPVEAQACGAPVIAFGKGGATETVLPLGGLHEPTGLWFEEQSTECLIETLRQFESSADAFHPPAVRRQALRFNQARFANELFSYLDQILRPEFSAARQAA
jgi:glycosyltransferase involved in cell wall biosynthesis